MTEEHSLGNKIRLICGQNNLICFKVNVGSVKLKDDRWFQTGLPKGFSDLIIFDDKGNIIFVETKIHPRKPTLEQIQFINTMKKRLFKAFVCYSVEEFIAVMKTYGYNLNQN